MATGNVHAGHRQRLRERAAKEGFASFNPHQVMELLLFYAVPQKDTSEMAHQLVNKFGTVQNVLTAPKEELMTIKGVGPKVADWLNRVGELMQSYGELKDTDRPCLRNYRDVLRFGARMGKKISAPSTYYMALTPSGTLLHFARMCNSLSWGVPDALKRCVNGMLTVHARSVIVIEFVGAGPVCEEDYEKQLAKLFAQTVNVMGAELLDVVLVGDQGVISMSRNGSYNRLEHSKAKSVLSENYLKEEIEPFEYDSDEFSMLNDVF